MQKLLTGYIKCGVIVAAMAGLVGMSACTKEQVKLVHYDTDTSGQLMGNAALKQRKVLLIGIDGAVASLVESIKPPVITGLLPQSVYTFSGMNDSVNTAGATWSTLMTGQTSVAHKIVDSTLIPRSVEGSHDAIKYYNSILYFIKDDNNSAKITSITQWADLNYFAMNSADKLINVKNTDGDKGVQDAAIKELNTASPDVLIVNFNSPSLAGIKSGFADNADYRQAITNVDTYIGELLKAVKARKNAAKEEWLVIIQNTTGGYLNRVGGGSRSERDNMTIYYSPIITPGRFDGPTYHDLGIRYTGGASNYIRAENNDGGLYNPADGEMTIEAKVRFNKGPRGNYTYSYPPFLSKIDSLDGTVNGWGFYRDGTDIAFAFQDGVNANEVRPGVKISDGAFHSIIATLKHTYDATNGHVYTASVFIDGTAKNTATIKKGEARIESGSPLVIGYRPVIYNDNNEIDMYLTDLRIWNVVLPDDIILKYNKTYVIDNTHPYYSKLIGDWRGNDHSGNVLHDYSPSKKDFTVTGKYTWDALGIVTQPNIPAAPCNKDVASSVLGWFGITLPTSTMPPGVNWIKVVGTK
ncbi:uncharacterized protein DUF4983 [Chitinophaga dinghuensis]|uniref:Uncharacterized protein DUF4983 n=1 Tax=Chitinophaga dinghuensis TaxID=1539050 RepID=A0A327W7K9_9BACT|nr:DUF4983 domain-containing protein [Chitinophaga dinghuensis]RAJ82018.1 uncharacterized protein DUF4983 [Chitinophaga dinghuensis]